ncbi:hypothetical protein GGS26DRAFT_302353 [Hypomontagnella submonticulosa]|nr:hypothetical protein GGS26DRAFT_302353 [Hypomontagnella submonticulosa]
MQLPNKTGLSGPATPGRINMGQATSHDDYNDLEHIRVPSVPRRRRRPNDLTAPPDPRLGSSTLPNLQEGTCVNQAPPSDQPVLPSNPYSSSFFRPNPIQPQQPSPTHSPSQLDSDSFTPKSQGATLPAPKRRKMEKSKKIQVISLLSDDEEDTTTQPNVESPVKGTRTYGSRKNSRHSRYSDFTPMPKSSQSLSSEHLTTGRIRQSTAAETPQKLSNASSMSSSESMRAAKALAKASIKQRSSIPPVTDSPSRTFSRIRGDTPSPATFSAPPSSMNASYWASTDDDSDHMPTPPPSSFLDADPKSPSQQKDPNPKDPYALLRTIDMRSVCSSRKACSSSCS